FRASGDVLSTRRVAVAISIGVTVPAGADLRSVKVQMQSDAEQRGALLQAVGRGGLQIVSKRNDRVVLLPSRDPGLSKLALCDSLRGQLAENHDFIVVNMVFLDLEDPLCIEAFVEPLNHGATFDVIEHVSIRAMPLLDLIGRKRSLQYFSIHTHSFRETLVSD